MDEGRNAPATKGDVQDLEVRLEEMEARLNERHEMLRAEMQHTSDDLKEVFRDAQTELLKAFYSFAEANGERVASVESDTGSLKKRLAMVETRVADLERRLMTPPPA